MAPSFTNVLHLQHYNYGLFHILYKENILYKQLCSSSLLHGAASAPSLLPAGSSSLQKNPDHILEFGRLSSPAEEAADERTQTHIAPDPPPADADTQLLLTGDCSTEPEGLGSKTG